MDDAAGGAGCSGAVLEAVRAALPGCFQSASTRLAALVVAYTWPLVRADGLYVTPIERRPSGLVACAPYPAADQWVRFFPNRAAPNTSLYGGAPAMLCLSVVLPEEVRDDPAAVRAAWAMLRPEAAVNDPAVRWGAFRYLAPGRARAMPRPPDPNWQAVVDARVKLHMHRRDRPSQRGVRGGDRTRADLLRDLNRAQSLFDAHRKSPRWQPPRSDADARVLHAFLVQESGDRVRAYWASRRATQLSVRWPTRIRRAPGAAAESVPGAVTEQVLLCHHRAPLLVLAAAPTGGKFTFRPQTAYP